MQVKSIQYRETEELLNILTHGLGFILSLAALSLLVSFSVLEGTALHVVSFTIYGLSLVMLYLASTVFHMATDQARRKRLRVFDHASIFLLIAGTYTPITMVTLQGPWGWSLFGTIWGLAILGILLKIFFTGRFMVISTILYVVMGWMILAAIYPLYLVFPMVGLVLLVLGGLSYTLGAVVFLLQRIPYHHVIFHVLVMIGSALHFAAIFWYVLQ